MSLTKYETFLEVAKTQNMSKAAANTHQTVPGVSYTISKLEEEFGFPLFVRSRGRISLTEAGEELRPYMMEVLQAQQRLEQAVASIKGMEWGTVRVGGLRSVTKRWLPGIIKDMNRKYPNIQIEIILNPYEEIENDLSQGIIDVALAGEPLSKMLEFHYMVDDPYVVVMAKSHPFSAKVSVSLEELREERFILPNWSSDKEIRSVPLSDWTPRRFGIVTAPPEKLSPSTRKFVQCAKEWIKNKKVVDISNTT